MASTYPDNIISPDLGDQYALVQDLGVVASTTQTALDRRANAFVGTAAQRAAYVDTATNGQLWQDTNGTKHLWRKDGSAWVRVVPDAPAMPRILTGTVTYATVTPDTTMPQTITFPAGFFTQPPRIMLTGGTGVTTGTVLHMWISGAVTTTSATIAIAKGSNFAQTVYWTAIQPVQ